MEEIKEEWRDIKGYEGLYQVSNFGRVWSNITNRIMKQKLSSEYFQIGLSKNNKQTFYCIHRLVAQAFIRNPNNYPCINHKDENKYNNISSNLEWCTYKYNNNYGTRLKRIRESNSGENHYLYGKHLSEEIKEKISKSMKGNIISEKNKERTREIRSKKVAQFSKDDILIKIWNSAREAYNTIGVNFKHISLCCLNKRKSAGGFNWRFV